MLIGTFVAAVLSFLVVATVLFFVIRAAARYQRSGAVETPGPDEVVLLREIHDLLEAQRAAATPSGSSQPPGNLA